MAATQIGGYFRKPRWFGLSGKRYYLNEAERQLQICWYFCGIRVKKADCSLTDLTEVALSPTGGGSNAWTAVAHLVGGGKAGIPLLDPCDRQQAHLFGRKLAALLKVPFKTPQSRLK